jgi:hypothetical protein
MDINAQHSDRDFSSNLEAISAGCPESSAMPSAADKDADALLETDREEDKTFYRVLNKV